MNVARLAERGRALMAVGIATSPVTVTISRDSDDQDETVDFATLAVTDSTPIAPITTGVRALIVTAGTTSVEVGTDRSQEKPTFTVFLPIATTNVAQDDVLTVTASRDDRLTGAQLLVTEVTDDPLGIARRLTARRL